MSRNGFHGYGRIRPGPVAQKHKRLRFRILAHFPAQIDGKITGGNGKVQECPRDQVQQTGDVQQSGTGLGVPSFLSRQRYRRRPQKRIHPDTGKKRILLQRQCQGSRHLGSGHTGSLPQNVPAVGGNPVFQAGSVHLAGKGRHDPHSGGRRHGNGTPIQPRPAIAEPGHFTHFRSLSITPPAHQGGPGNPAHQRPHSHHRVGSGRRGNGTQESSPSVLELGVVAPAVQLRRRRTAVGNPDPPLLLRMRGTGLQVKGAVVFSVFRISARSLVEVQSTQGAQIHRLVARSGGCKFPAVGRQRTKVRTTPGLRPEIRQHVFTLFRTRVENRFHGSARGHQALFMNAVLTSVAHGYGHQGTGPGEGTQ